MAIFLLDVLDEAVVGIASGKDLSIATATREAIPFQIFRQRVAPVACLRHPQPEVPVLMAKEDVLVEAASASESLSANDVK